MLFFNDDKICNKKTDLLEYSMFVLKSGEKSDK